MPGTERYRVTRIQNYASTKPSLPPELLFNIPVYVGVGMRISSNVLVTGATANISGIGVIGAEAEAQNVKGSLVVQTLGVNGKSVAAALPIQSELNRTTAQNAIVAVGSIKALLHADETVKAPIVVVRGAGVLRVAGAVHASPDALARKLEELEARTPPVSGHA